MAAGLQVWDASGNIMLDTTSRMTRVLGSFSIAAGQAAGSVTNAALSSGEPWIFASVVHPGGAGSGGAASTFSFSGNTLSWTKNGIASYSDTIFVIYGVY
jgi:hypothetical protein